MAKELPKGTVLPYNQMGAVDSATAGALQNFMSSAGAGTVELPPDLQNMLTARYKAFNFQAPKYNVNIESVADLPDHIKQAMMQRTLGGITRTSEGQRQQAKDMMLRIGRGNSGGLAAALRDINRGEMEQGGNASIQSMIDEANRRFEEAKTVRGLNIDDARFRAGLDDMLQTRRAAEAEKVYQSEYGRQQDLINTIMNQAAFRSGERANQASRQQAAIQQGLNYTGQAGAYRQNLQQLQNKKGLDPNIVGVQGATQQPTYKSFSYTPFQTQTQRTSQVQPYSSYQYQGGYS